jgi:hypothetical protein
VLGYEHNSLEIMTFSKKNNRELTQTEWNEMVALKNAIDYDITQVHPEKMEEFTEYLVRSLKERGG